MSANHPGASSSTVVGVVETCRFTGVPKSSDEPPTQPPATTVATTRPAISRRSGPIECRTQAACQVTRHVAELGRGLGRRAPVRDTDGRPGDLTEVVWKAHRP